MDLAQTLADASGSLLLALLVIAVGMGKWIVLARELRTSESRLVEMKAERDEWKEFALRSVNLGERVVEVAKGGGR